MTKKVILVTGANRGIGKAVVEAFLQLGHTVILSSRNKERGQEAFESLSQKGDLHFHPLDVDDDDSINILFDFVVEKFERLDVLINNAGINYDLWQTASSANLEEVHQTLETNLFGPWRLCQKFIPLMKRNGYGRIVNVSSGSGALRGMGSETPGYGASKAALNVLSIKLGIELQGTGILVNSVCPGWVRTDMGGKDAPRTVEQGAETIVWAGLLPDDGPTGKFLRDKKEIDL